MKTEKVMNKFKRKFIIEFETNDVHTIRNIDSTMKEFFSWGKFRECDVKLKEVE